MGASQFRKRHSERSDSEVKNPDLAQGLEILCYTPFRSG